MGGDKVLGLHPGLAIVAVGLWAGDSTSPAPSFLISKKEPVGMSSDARIVGGTQHLAHLRAPQVALPTLVSTFPCPSENPA